MPEHQPEEIEEARAPPNTEEFLDIAGIEAVQPFRVVGGIRIFRQESLREPSVEQAVIEISHAEFGLAFRPEDWRKMEECLAARERVAKLPGSRERRRARRQQSKPGECIGRLLLQRIFYRRSGSNASRFFRCERYAM